MSRFNKITVVIALLSVVFTLIPLGTKNVVSLNVAYAALPSNFCTSFVNPNTGVNAGFSFQTQNADGGVTCSTASESSKETFNSSGAPEALAVGGQNVPINQDGTIIQGPTYCSGFWSQITSPGTCIMRALFAGTGAFLIWIGTLALTVAGFIFEFALTATVVQFPTYFYTTGVATSVNTAWTVFRDLANILIIGMFVFIAINIILGNKTFGEKRLIAKVLIIAVLINFSMLFAQMIVDASNFTASQFYVASGLKQQDDSGVPSGNSNTNLSTTGSTVSNTSSSGGLAGSFIGFLGVSGFGDSYNALRNIQENNDSAFLALGYGVLSFIFLISTTFVFLYGAYLLLMRGLIIIFIFLTSSVAFATYLLPESTIFVKKGWELWWGSLLRSAVLAPLLMLMLWITLTVSRQMNIATQKLSGGGDLGQLMTASGGAAGMQTHIAVLFNFIIILGLLFLSFKISSIFASNVAGMNFLGAGLSKLAGSAVSLATGGAGTLARQGLGRFAYDRQRRQNDQGQAASAERERLLTLASGTNDAIKKAEYERQAQAKEREAETAARSAARAGKLAERKFGGQQSYAGAIQNRAKAATALAQKATPDANKIRAAAAEQVRSAAQDDLTKMRGAVEAGQQLADAARKQSQEATARMEDAQNKYLEKFSEVQNRVIDLARQTTGPNGNNPHQSDIQDIDKAQTERATISTRRGAIDKQLQTEILSAVAGGDKAKEESLKQQLSQSREARISEMRHQAERIKQAHDNIIARNTGLATDMNVGSSIAIQQAADQTSSELSSLEEDLVKAAASDAIAKDAVGVAQKNLHDAQNALNQRVREVDAAVLQAQDAQVRGVQQLQTSVAGAIGRGNVFARLGGSERVAALARSSTEKGFAGAKLREALNSAIAENGGGGGGNTHP